MKDEEELNVSIGMNGGMVDLTYSKNQAKSQD
jgi:hypothetical protein